MPSPPSNMVPITLADDTRWPVVTAGMMSSPT
jgi:hypothetical protein